MEGRELLQGLLGGAGPKHLGEFRDEIHRSFAEFRDEMNRTSSEFREEMRRSFTDFRDEIRRDRQVAQRQLLFVLVVAFLSLLGTVATSL